MYDKREWLFEAPFTEEDFQATPATGGGYKSLSAAASDRSLLNVGGNYTIRWKKSCTNPGQYKGETENLQGRIQQHQLSLSHLGLDPNKYEVLTTNRQRNPTTKKAKAERKERQEKAIASGNRKGVGLTNQTSRETEFEKSWLFEVPPRFASFEADYMARVKQPDHVNTKSGSWTNSNDRHTTSVARQADEDRKAQERSRKNKAAANRGRQEQVEDLTGSKKRLTEEQVKKLITEAENQQAEVKRDLDVARKRGNVAEEERLVAERNALEKRISELKQLRLKVK